MRKDKKTTHTQNRNTNSSSNNNNNNTATSTATATQTTTTTTTTTTKKPNGELHRYGPRGPLEFRWELCMKRLPFWKRLRPIVHLSAYSAATLVEPGEP